MSKAKIMVVEDEYVVAADIQSALENLGYEVPAVESTAEEAIEQAERLRPDLVLMDIVLMGEMNGIEAAEKIRSRFDIPVIYLTAHVSGQILSQARETEPFGYLVKPFDEVNLKSTIEVALYRARTESHRKKFIVELQNAISSAKTMKGTLCICSSCKKIRVQEKRWEHIEDYITQHSEAGCVHTICLDCLKKLLPDHFPDKEGPGKRHKQ
ncbi:MAG: response regulator [Candidatus Glassbacteria bacterium]|nr:response regulator [Candidatus Glassbacteria bacterium]